MNLRDAIAHNARVIANVSTHPGMKSMLSVLREARVETDKGLSRWLKKVDGPDTYTIQRHRALIAELGDAVHILESDLASAIGVDLRTGARIAGTKSLDALKRVALAGERRFRDATTPLRLDIAALLRDSSHVLMHRHVSSAQRYAGRRGRDIQHQLAIGVIRGETVDQLVRRIGVVTLPRYKRMSLGQKADAFADNQFFKSKSDGERLVRTEMNHAANAIQVDALVTANREVGGDGGWRKRWDATIDRRTCAYCDDLNGVIADAHDKFFSRLIPEGVFAPPLHPCDRCSVSPWRDGWSL